jgi:hypothetical protein
MGRVCPDERSLGVLTRAAAFPEQTAKALVFSPQDLALAQLRSVG